MLKALSFSLILFSVINLNSQIDKGLENKLKISEKDKKADTLKWYASSVYNLGFNRVGLYNWAGGGQSSMSIQGLISANAGYSYKKILWKNTLDLAYGIIKTGASSSYWFKNDDRIEISSKFGFVANKHWAYTAFANFRTQFYKGYNSVVDSLYVSDFLSPAYQIAAIGFDYTPNKEFAWFYSPITIKTTIVLNDSLSNIGAFGVNQGENIRTELGGYIKFVYNKKNLFDIKNSTFKTTLSLFNNYIEQSENVDITWEMLFSLKLKKYLSLTFSTYLIYDDDIQIARYNNDGNPIYYTRDDGSYYLDNNGVKIQKKGPITQFKETFGLGLSFTY